ncbi:MAG: polysaccharide biosynthesis protein [Desulfobacula sp.]|uniref:polysaccharide biosynthesis protein n=1 Tax=Desulfobacula sp. TaxID=2593537 RepID=UPI0025BD2AFC|nr:nucleoside-diphosphate sugar epimerase/dehydratase [Desulfobacula sp.]MCD4722741.1 polysaccharide biosynthesis protein [Desulfobacula sp.]
MKIRLSRNFFIVFLADIGLLSCSFYLSYMIRFDFQIPEWAFENFIEILPYVLIVKVLCFLFFDLYKGMWRYTSLNDLVNVTKASTIGVFCTIVLVLYLNRFEGTPRSVFIIDWCLTLIFIGGLRFAARLLFDQFSDKKSLKSFTKAILQIFHKKHRESTGVIIVGAGNCGEKICREIRDNPIIGYHVSGFLDDDTAKIGRKIHGISVLDSIDEIEYYTDVTDAKEVIIAIPSASARNMRHIVDLCTHADVKFRIVPGMGELINGRVTVNSIRDVEYRDLLGRKPVNLDQEKIGGYLRKKRVLVTGAGGSIGSGLCRQICRYSPEKIILLERAESPLYEIDLQLKKDFRHIEIIPVLADIQNEDEVETIFNDFHPDIVFHAAAYKHVPMLEEHPWKAVENNITGTLNMVEITDRYGCEKFVLVSTDKAVNPTNIMGASKRIAELIVQKKNLDARSETRLKIRSKTNFITVRFGNVIGSVGSVIPLFKKQIKEGGPVTVTHQDMIRYFMLIPEACQLILQSGAMGKGGEIFILEMGKPVKIDDMAKDLIRFSGLEPGVDIKIVYTGLRPGEKLYEELMTANEGVVPTKHDKIMVLNTRQCNIDKLSENIEVLKKLVKSRDRKLIVDQLTKMVPEYTPV